MSPELRIYSVALNSANNLALVADSGAGAHLVSLESRLSFKADYMKKDLQENNLGKIIFGLTENVQFSPDS